MASWRLRLAEPSRGEENEYPNGTSKLSGKVSRVRVPDRRHIPFAGSCTGAGQSGARTRQSFGAPNPPIQGASAFTMYCWLRSDEPYPERTLVAGFGELTTASRTQQLFLAAGRPAGPLVGPRRPFRAYAVPTRRMAPRHPHLLTGDVRAGLPVRKIARNAGPIGPAGFRRPIR
jgi:hypothetical protein